MKKILIQLIMAFAMIMSAARTFLTQKREAVPLALQMFADPALESISSGFAISDIEAVVITTASKSYLIKTNSEATAKPAISQGQEKELRKGNVIHALNKTKDLIKGYDIDFTQVLLHPEVLAIVNGGTATFTTGAFASYAAPVAGQAPTLIPFRLDIYCADKDTDGNNKGYLKFSLPSCEGVPTEFTFKDGEFFAPKFTVKNRPAGGTSPMEITPAAAIPTVSAG